MKHIVVCCGLYCCVIVELIMWIISYTGSVILPYKIEDYFSNFCEELCWNCDRDCTESVDYFFFSVDYFGWPFSSYLSC